MELKPCPFCGGRAALYVNSGGIQAMCLECYVSTPRLSDSLTSNGISGNATQAVIDKWNRRASDEQT